MIKGLIFDLDGVIVNTDIYHFEAWKQVASQYSIQLDSSINERLKGLSRRDSWNLIMELGNIKLSEEETNLILEAKNGKKLFHSGGQNQYFWYHFKMFLQCGFA